MAEWPNASVSKTEDPLRGPGVRIPPFPLSLTPQFFMMDIAVCFCLFEGKILLLQRAAHKPEGLLWTAPSGKCDSGETPEEGAKRELMEETGIQLALGETLENRGKFIQHYAEHSIVIHLFLYEMKSPAKVILRPDEHINYCWVKPIEALWLPIMEGAETCIQKVFQL